MPMKRRSKTTGMRVGLLLALLIGILGSHWKDILPASEPDPDEIHVLQQGGKFGKLSLEVKEAGSHLHMPARLYFTYDDGREELPVVGRFQHFLVTASGRDLKTLPVGEYQVYVSRGTEYSLDRQKVKIEEGKTAYLNSTLERVVDTSGFISADFHLHLQYAMRDGAMTSAAEGIDLLTATDHNILKDYSPPHSRAQAGALHHLHRGFGDRHRLRPLQQLPPGDRSLETARVSPRHPDPGGVPAHRPAGTGRADRADQPSEAADLQPPSAAISMSGSTRKPELSTTPISKPVSTASRSSTPSPTRAKPLSGAPGWVDQKLQDWYRLLNRGVLMAGVANTDAHRYPQDSLGYPPQLRGFRNRQPLGNRRPQGRPGRQAAGRHRQPRALPPFHRQRRPGGIGDHRPGSLGFPQNPTAIGSLGSGRHRGSDPKR